MAMKYIPPVTRVDKAKTHYYQDGDGKRIPGVTTILGGGIPKPNLINWAANTTAEYAVDHWDELGDKPVAERLKILQGARYEITNQAKNKGTQVHQYAEQLVQGHPVNNIPANLVPYVDNLARFYDAWKVDGVFVESTIVNYTLGYAGTLDLVAEITTAADEQETWLLDIKTGEKGVFGETALQLAAYRYAEFYVDNQGKEQHMLPVEHCGAIHVTADDAVLIPTVSDRDELKAFGAAYRIYENDLSGLIGAPEPEPKRSTARLIWEEHE